MFDANIFMVGIENRSSDSNCSFKNMYTVYLKPLFESFQQIIIHEMVYNELDDDTKRLVDSYREKEGYKDTGFKAMLATNRKRDAVSYLTCFEQFGDLNCEVCISPPDMREGIDDIDEGTDNRVIAYWNKMMKKYGDADAYEDSVKNRFVDGEIDILIVCSKLLTGFDAPRCQVLYIDKELKEHGLLQAIARTNRLYDGKDYGLIVDYRGLIQKLDDAMNMYSGAGLENFEAGDLKGAIVDIISAVGNLRQSYTRLEDLFVSIKNKNDVEEIEIIFFPKLYRINSQFFKSFYMLCKSSLNGKHTNSHIIFLFLPLKVQFPVR